MPAPLIAITCGDAAGIGPEIALRAAADPAVTAVCHPLIIGQRALLERVAAQLRLPMPTDLCNVDVPGFAAAAVMPGQVQAACGALGAACVERAVLGCRSGEFAAMATAPLNKEALHAAGVPFPGHTELLAARCGVADPVMCMDSRVLTVALVTIHQSLASVPSAITPQAVVHVGQLLADHLRRRLGRAPRLAVLGLNPHAGEGGLFGSEEAAIRPAVYELLQLGIDADGPVVPDAAFTPHNRARYDGYVCMYHDQGLIPFKALAFDEGVQVTLGLPIVRTSVDHGTAFDIAWQGVAEHRSMINAVRLAAQLAV